MGLLSTITSLFGQTAPVDESRWIMLDVEASGLDTQRDRLIAIAAIALRVDWKTKKLLVDIGDSFEVILQQEQTSSKDNILLHGIGAQKQRDGINPLLALQTFNQFVGASPLLAFHAAFDETMIQRYQRKYLNTELPNVWLDIDHLCAVTYEKVRARALDDWMAYFGIRCAIRHQAVADTLAECELLQRIWPKVSAQCSKWDDVKKLAKQQRWVRRAG
jgi:DNA polymerase III subunit epsilon